MLLTHNVYTHPAIDSVIYIYLVLYCLALWLSELHKGHWLGFPQESQYSVHPIPFKA